MRRSIAGIHEALGSAVLQLRRRAASSRSSLSQALGVAPSTGGLYADLLIESGYLSESGLDQGPMGRPKRALVLRPEAGWFAGIEFHAARLQAVRVDFGGQFAAPLDEALPVSADAPAVVAAVAAIVQRLAAGAAGPLLAIGVGAPGLVDPRGGIGIEYRFIAQWRDVALVEALRARFAVPVWLEHNLRAIALAERWFGAGLELNDFVCLGLRSGFGAGIVAGGRLIGGKHHAAGELGRWPWMAAPGEPVGELQDRLSAPAIFRRVKGLAADASVPSDLHGAFASRVPKVLTRGAVSAPWEPVIGELGRVVACLHLLLDPGAFFLHGPLTALGAEFCDAVAGVARDFEGGTNTAPLNFRASTLGSEAGALGAASLAMESWAPALK
jgi:predicted NBD/HSP70 family sugar kinase